MSDAPTTGYDKHLADERADIAATIERPPYTVVSTTRRSAHRTPVAYAFDADTAREIASHLNMLDSGTDTGWNYEVDENDA